MVAKRVAVQARAPGAAADAEDTGGPAPLAAETDVLASLDEGQPHMLIPGEAGVDFWDDGQRYRAFPQFGGGAVVGTKGDDVELPAGTVVTVVLDQPLVIPGAR